MQCNKCTIHSGDIQVILQRHSGEINDTSEGLHEILRFKFPNQHDKWNVTNAMSDKWSMWQMKCVKNAMWQVQCVKCNEDKCNVTNTRWPKAVWQMGGDQMQWDKCVINWGDIRDTLGWHSGHIAKSLRELSIHSDGLHKTQM